MNMCRKCSQILSIFIADHFIGQCNRLTSHGFVFLCFVGASTIIGFPSNAEIVIIFRTIESTDDQVHNAKMIMICLLFCFSHLCSLLLLNLQSFHYLFSFFIFINHNIAHTQICYNDGSQTQHIVCIFIHNRLIISDRFVISLQNKEHMSHIQFPSLMIGTKLCTLSE